MAEVKSAIREVRDQLFLDRADGKYLSNVGANIGFERPQFGFQSDRLWRAIVRRGALDYKQIANLFEDWLTEFFGPRKTVVTVLGADAAVLDDQITISDQLNIPQQGTLVIDEGLATEQTTKYSFRDPRNGLVDIDTAISLAVTAALNNATGYLISDISIGATLLGLVNGLEFPTSGFSYTLLIDPGTDVEEVVELTAHPTDHSLTVTPTAFAHNGIRPSSRVSNLSKVEGGGSVLTLGKTAHFPATGLIRVMEPGGGVFETAEYFTNDVENDVLQLRSKLVNTYTLGTSSVTLMRPGAKVQLAQVQVKGKGWDIFETQARKLQIFIPETLDVNRLLDVSYLHDSVGTTPASTLAIGASAGETQIQLADASPFPGGGTLIINSGGGNEEKIGYNRVDRFDTTLMPASFKARGVIQAIVQANLLDAETFTLDDGTNPAVIFEFDKVPDGVGGGNIVVDISSDVTAADVAITIRNAINGVGGSLAITARIDPEDNTKVLLANDAFGSSGNTTSSETVADAGFTVSNMTGGSIGYAIGTLQFYVMNPKALSEALVLTDQLVLSRGLGAEEVVTIETVNNQTGLVTLVVPTTNAHASGATAEMGDPNILFLARGLGNTHLAAETVAIDEDEYPGTDLEIGDPTVAPNDTARFQGPYNASIFDQALDSAVGTVLAENVAGPVDLLVDQSAGSSSLEVRDAILFETTGQFDLRVGRGKGADETVDLTGVVYARDVQGLLTTAAVSINDLEFSLSPTDVAKLPNPPGGPPFGYRVAIEFGGVNEERVLIDRIDGNLVRLVFGFTKAHPASSEIRLVADVFELSERLEFNHRGVISQDDKLQIYPKHRLAKDVHKVEEVRTSLEVASLAGFPTVGGKVLINFGRQQLRVVGKLAVDWVQPSTSAVLEVSDDFPTSGFPYFVRVDVGTNLERYYAVTANNTGTETLTIPSSSDFTHPAGAEVRYDPGDPVILEYSGVLTTPNRLEFENGILMSGPLLTGTPVDLSSVTAQPGSRGFEYPFYLPSTWADRLKFLFDRGRAAGVEIVTISSK